MKQARWVDEIVEANEEYRSRITRERLPVDRLPGSRAIVTCMDPRVNLAAVGVAPFEPDGSLGSAVRVIRTLGGVFEERSLIVGIHLAGIREVALLMHTGCAGSIAWAKIDILAENMRNNVGEERFQQFQRELGEPLTERLRERLQAFPDPGEALRGQVARLRDEAFVPSDVQVHGLLLDITTGRVEVVVDGSESSPQSEARTS
jgi:carbonic anhydrase